MDGIVALYMAMTPMEISPRYVKALAPCFCEHANEAPIALRCICPANCSCRISMCGRLGDIIPVDGECPEEATPQPTMRNVLDELQLIRQILENPPKSLTEKRMRQMVSASLKRSRKKGKK